MGSAHCEPQFSEMFSLPPKGTPFFSSVDLYHKKLRSTMRLLTSPNETVEICLASRHKVFYATLNSASWSSTLQYLLSDPLQKSVLAATLQKFQTIPS